MDTTVSFEPISDVPVSEFEPVSDVPIETSKDIPFENKKDIGPLEKEGLWAFRSLFEPSVKEKQLDESIRIMRGPSEGPSLSPIPGAIAGASQAAGDIIKSLTSPVGLTTLGMGALPTTAQKIVSGVFAADMARHIPEQAQEAGRLSVEGDTQGSTRANLGLAGTAAFAGLASAHAVPRSLPRSRAELSKTKPVEPAPVETPVVKQEPLPLSEVVPEVKTPEMVTPVERTAIPEADPNAVKVPVEELNPTPVTPVESVRPSSNPVLREEALKVAGPELNAVALTPDGERINVIKEPRDYGSENDINSPQHIFGSGRLGEKAKAAWETMQLAVFDMNHSIGKDVKQYVDGVTASLPREFSKKGGKAFYEVLDGKDMAQITSELSGKKGGEQVIKAAEQVKGRLEEIRTVIRDTKAESYKESLRNLDRATLKDLYEANVGPSKGIKTPALIDALVSGEFPKDWGIKDGYLHHLFSGTWKITVKRPGSSEAVFVNRAKTEQEARAKIYDLTKKNPDLKGAEFTVERDIVVPDEVVRLGDKKLFQMIEKMKQQTGLTTAEIREAQSGIIGRKAAKEKRPGFLMKREGFLGYSKDFVKTMTTYLSGFHRWKILNETQKKVAPLIEGVRSEGRTSAADRLDELNNHLWGKPSKTTTDFDKTLAKIPGLNRLVAPRALDRWSGQARSMVSHLALTTPRFWIVNRLQPLSGLYPLVGEKLIAEGKIFQHTKAGRDLLDAAGVTFDPGQYSTGVRGKLSEIREKLTGERSNQELAFLSTYLHGKKMGLGETEAIRYGKLRGQLATQFTPSVVDNPKIFEGPIASAVFQFKRFPVKQLELFYDTARNKNVPGIVRMLSMYALTGGVSFFLKQLWSDDRTKYHTENALKKEFGESVGNVMMYGLPALVGADVSSSIVLSEEPMGQNIFEKVGRTLTGPGVGMAANFVKNVTTEERVPMDATDKTIRALKSFPATKQLAELHDLATGNLDITTPDGETKYRKTLKDSLMAIGSFKPTDIASMNTALSAFIELEKEATSLKNQIFISLGDDAKMDEAFNKRNEFNARWPERAITDEEVGKYLKSRIKGFFKTDLDRIAGRKYRGLIPERVVPNE